jgi:hypothetical protein
MKKPVQMHKEGQETISVMPTSVGVWTRNGWTLVDDGDSETPPAPGEPDHVEGVAPDQNEEKN